MSLHNAPPVTYPLGRSSLLGGLLLGVWLAGLLLVLAWHGLAQPSPWRLSAGLGAVLLAGLAAGLRWKNAPHGSLAWDGEAWHWESASCPGSIAAYELSVVADLHNCLLLRLDNPAGASLWLWAQQRALPARWLALRRAVYSPRKSSSASAAHDLLAPGLWSATAPGAGAVAVSTAMAPTQATRAQP